MDSPSSDPRKYRRNQAQVEEGVTRKHVLGTVYDLISEHGIESLSMRQVAQACQLSTGTINYHFGNKQRLLIAALESAYELPPEWEQYGGSPSHQLRRLVLSYVCRSARDRFWRFWINYLALSTRDDELLARQKQRYERQLRFWTQLIGDGLAAGEIRPGVDPNGSAGEMLVMAHGLLLRQLITPDSATRAEARRVLEERLDAISVR